MIFLNNKAGIKVIKYYFSMNTVCWILLVVGLVAGRVGAVHEKIRNGRHLTQLSAEEEQALDELIAALAPRSPASPSPPPASPPPPPRESRSPPSSVTTAPPTSEKSPQQPSPPPSPPSPQPANASPAEQPSPPPVPSPSPQTGPPAVSLPSGPPLAPAPALFSRSFLPSFSFTGSGPGPVDPAALQDTAPSGQCRTLGEVLSAIPEASRWLSVLQNSGLESILLTDSSVRTTLLVPINSAFTAGIDARPLGREESTVDQLIANDGTLQTAMIGYSTVRGLWPASTLKPGTTLSTFASIDKVNPLAIQVGEDSQLQLLGIGSTATIVQADIAACGPSIAHLVDQVLLPFRFDQGAIDAITGTQANS